MMKKSLLFRSWSMLMVAALAACSFVNTFDEVKPLIDGTYAPGETPPPPVDAGATPPVDSGGSPDTAPPPPPAKGVIVVGGQVETDGAVTSVLTALDAEHGRELGAREPMVVASVRYDGLRDIWYIFESKSTDYVLSSTDEMTIHIRALDSSTGVWTELGKLEKAPPLQYFDSIAVLNERLLYIAHPESGTAVRLVTIDTSNPVLPSIVGTPATTTPTPRGMLGVRNAGPGGIGSLVRVVPCNPPANNPQCLEVAAVGVSNQTTVINAAVRIGQVAGQGAVPAYGSFASSDFEKSLIVFPRTSADAGTMVHVVDPRLQSTDFTVTFRVNDSLLRRAAVSECDRQMFIVGGNADLDLHSVPIAQDPSAREAVFPTGHSGQSVYFEPVTKTVLAPFSQGSGFELSAFRLGGTRLAPTLSKRTSVGNDWVPPKDLRPIFLGIRETLPIACP